MGPAPGRPAPPEPRPPGGGRPSRPPRGQRLRRAAQATLIVTAGLAGYLYGKGLPRWALTIGLDRLAEEGVIVEAETIRWRWGRGLVAAGVRYYDSPLRITPVAEAEEVALRFRPGEWLRGRAGVRTIALRGAVVRVGDGAVLHRTPPEQVVTLHDVSGQLALQRAEIVVRDVQARVFGMRLAGEGCVVRPIRESGGPPPDAESGSGTEAAGARVRSGVRQMLIRELQGIAFADQPLLRVRFVVFQDDPARSTIRVDGAGGGAMVRGVAFDEWSFEADYEDRVVRLKRGEAVAGGRRMEASAEVDLKRDVARGRLESTLPPAHWLSLMPREWRDQLSTMKIFVQGRAEVGLDVGPAPLSALWQSLRGRASLEAVEAAGIWVERGDLAFEVDERAVHVHDVDLEIGNPSQRGSLEGECTVALPDRSFRGRCRGDVDFRAFLPLLNPDQVELVHRFQFGERKPRVQVEFAGRPGVREALYLRGELEASSFSYRGAYCDYGRANILTSNRVTRLDPIRIERGDGAVEGLIRIDFRERTVEFEADSRIDPKALARATSDTLQRILTAFSFEGPTSVKSRGRIQVGDWRGSEAEARVESERIGLKSFVADRAAFDVRWQGERVTAESIEADLYGGRVSGRYEVFAESGGPRPRYRVEGDAAGVRFEDVVRTLFHKEGEPYRGRIDGTLALTGILGEGQAPLARGEGWVRIRDGRITQIAVFGGLSRLLSRIFPGLGFTTQTDFECRFAVNGWTLSLSDVKIQGNVFSLTGDGAYDLQTRTLDFDVEFRLLREGVVGSVVQWVTSPLTNLIKFDLEGTWENPRWRPKNLPKELFDGFGG